MNATSRHRWPGAAAALALALAGEPAAAYCRSSTCSAPGADSACQENESGCMLGGKPLAWPGACVSFSVHRSGAPGIALSSEALSALVAAAFERWTSADCGGALPSITIEPTPRPVLCGQPEHNSDAANANVWMAEPSAWAYQKNALAVTTVTFDADSGAILDADVELNTVGAELTVDDANVVYDLASIIQHESGHFLGLGHSGIRDATMWRRVLRGSIESRSLHSDDALAVCDAYPPLRPAKSCDFTPRNGWSERCAPDSGCHVSRARAPASPRLWPLLLLVAIVRRGLQRTWRCGSNV